MNDFLDRMPLVMYYDEETIESAANHLIGEAHRRYAFLEFVKTPCEGEIYRAPEYRT